MKLFSTLTVIAAALTVAPALAETGLPFPEQGALRCLVRAEIHSTSVKWVKGGSGSCHVAVALTDVANAIAGAETIRAKTGDTSPIWGEIPLHCLPGSPCAGGKEAPDGSEARMPFKYWVDGQGAHFLQYPWRKEKVTKVSPCGVSYEHYVLGHRVCK